jgi:hypothetical protein
MTSKKGSFLIPSKMQKELQCVGSGLALDELMEASEMSVKLQETFIYDTFHGKSDDSNSIGLVETIISGTGIVKDMYCSKEIEVVDPTTSTKSSASYLQMKDICTLDPSKAYMVGKLITKEVLHGSTKKTGGPWAVGRSLHSQGSKVHKNCKKALGYGRQFLDADGFVKSGNLQPDYFHYVNTAMHKLKFPERLLGSFTCCFKCLCSITLFLCFHSFFSHRSIRNKKQNRAAKCLKTVLQQG